MCTYKFGFSPMQSTFSLELVKEGYAKENLANISTFLMPLSFGIAIYASKKVKKGTEMSYVQLCFLLRFVDSLFAYFVLKMFPFI